MPPRLLSALILSTTLLGCRPLLFGMEPITAPSAVSVEGFTYVKTVRDISEYTLDANGLQVLLMPDHSAPVTTFMVTYHVGSRNEVTGSTGSTHLLEHLMFKGTEKFQRSKGTGIDQLLERIGAEYNATTSNDRTNYFESLPSDQLPLAIEIEADRMRNLLLRETDRRPEMTVVRNEFERGENDPFDALIKEIYAGAYIAHPYHHPIIGWRSDIEKVPIEKLRAFYDLFYWPNNATVSVIGDFQSADALQQVRKFYGTIPRAPHPIPSVYTEEPEQSAPRHVGVKRAGELGVVAIGYKTPSGTHLDYPPLNVLVAILTDGKNSRLYRALTDKNLTTGVDSDVGFHRDPSLDIIFGSLAPATKPEEVERIMEQEIERVKKDGVTDVEVATAINKIVADDAFQRDGSFKIASNLNESIASGDWTTYYTVEDRTRQVTAADVKRVANLYFNEDQSTTGWFIPIQESTAAAEKAAPPEAPHRAATRKPSDVYYFRDPALGLKGEPASSGETAGTGDVAAGPGLATASHFATNVVHQRIAGIDTLIDQTGVHDVVTIRAALPAGDVFSPGQNVAVAKLTGALLDKGTRQQDKFSIAQKLESVGASLHFGVDRYNLTITAQCLRKDLPLVLSLIAEQLREPAFAPAEFEKAKKQMIGELHRKLESTDQRATEALSQALYPVGHPNRQASTAELLTAVELTTLEQVKQFHAAYYGPEHMILVAVGDLTPEAVKADLTQVFSGWNGGVAVPTSAPPSPQDRPFEQIVYMADKTSVTVEFGETTGLKYTDPDYQSLRLATSILGNGFTSRLMANVRDKEGLTYDIESFLQDDTYNGGDWQLVASFAPALLNKGLDSTQRQLTEWVEHGVTAAELEHQKGNVIGTFKVNLSTTTGLARQLLINAQRGNDPSFLDRFPELVNRITLQEVNTALQKYVHLDRMVKIEAGTVPGAVPVK